uniref:SnoaL-like domain-containing protein n=1 Tax=Pyrodinium bahamense TaxID=73915 RepID=A0A7S0FU56_9DINO
MPDLWGKATAPLLPHPMGAIWVGPVAAAQNPALQAIPATPLAAPRSGRSCAVPGRQSKRRQVRCFRVGTRVGSEATTAAAATAIVAVGCTRSSKRRWDHRGGQATRQAAASDARAVASAAAIQSPQTAAWRAVWVPPALAVAAVAGERTPKVLSAQQLVQRLFVQGKASKESAFSPNSWYESPDTTTNSQRRVWQYWQVRPTRRIDKICDGKRSCGCTWTQVDGRRGVSFFRFDQDGKVSFVREIPEPDGWRKFKTNNMESLKPLFSIMGTIQNVFSFADQYLSVNREPLRPRIGLAAPRSRRAPEVVQYLWEEAFCAEDAPIDRVMAEYSEAAVYEDMTYVDEKWAKGKEAVRKYQEETKINAPENLRFVLDEISDGQRSCTVVWHVEYGGQKSPRGVSFYELDEEGKVSYVRSSYDLSF